MDVEKKTAVLVGVHLPQMTSEDLESSLQELSRLVHTLGYMVVGQVTQRRGSDRAASLLGSGKLRELAKWTGGSGIVASMVDRKLNKAALKKAELEQEDVYDLDLEEDEEALTDEVRGTAQVVIVDTDLSPSQIRNLESACGVTVLDRTGVIIEIFSRHARTRAARLQVEIARLSYVAPRLRETGSGQDRQGGGVGGKGAGETHLELDRRKIRDRIKELKSELAAIGNEHEVRRARRSQERSVALVGYTNAGKSSLMRAMTGSDVLVADKLFATLDTTVRPLHPETRPRVLLSDTVGFIKRLPHDLVASFKSTLDEAVHASFLLFVVDASDPAFRSQLEVTSSVLSEVGAVEAPRLLVLNKRDRLTEDMQRALREEFPEAEMISTRDRTDLNRLRDRILAQFEMGMVDKEIFVSYLAQGILGEIREKMRVLAETYDELGVTLKVRAPQSLIAQIQKKTAVFDKP